MKPILFNTEMVRAILDGRKTCTRRVVKPQPVGKMQHIADGTIHGYWMGGDCQPFHPSYHTGDILYVRETWCQYGRLDEYDRLIDGTEIYYYRADGENPTPFNDFLVQHPGWDEHRENPVWRPSIYMPKEAARLFLRVTDVKAERLQDMTVEDATIDFGLCPEAIQTLGMDLLCKGIWDSTIPKEKLPVNGWDANPWVWAYSLSRSGRRKF